MKTKLFALTTFILMSIGAKAQIDRSKQPIPGPAPKISLEVPGEFQLENGLKVLVVENHKLPRVSYTLRLDNPPISEGDRAGVSSLLGSMLGNGTLSLPKDDFNEEIDFLGANLNFGPQNASARTLSKYSERILQLMADAVINPLLTEEEFQKEKDKLIEGLKIEEKSVDAIARRVGRALSYGIKHPYGEFVTPETANNVSLDNVRAFYETYFTPNNAYLVVVGDVDFKTIKKQVKKYFDDWKKSLNVTNIVPEPKSNVQYTQINFVDMPNAVQSNISVTNNADLKMSHPDYHAVLIANYILGGGDGYLFNNLRETHGYTYGAYSRIRADKYISRFLATAEVRNVVTDSSIVEILKEITRIKKEPIDAKALNNAKAKYVGKFVLDLENPQNIANYSLNMKINDLPIDFYTTYLQKINNVTAQDVNRVANKYFKTENARVIVVGKGNDIIKNLEKIGIPIKYFDTNANTVEKPVFSKPIPSGVTAETIFKNYIKAVGGKKNLEKVNTVLTLANVTIEGAPFKPIATIKVMTPNKVSMEMNIEGMGTILKQKFDGTTGYKEQQGTKTPMTEKEVSDKQAEKGLFPELYIEVSNLTLENIATIDGSDLYKIKVTRGNGISFRYYDIETGLLVRSESTKEAQGQSVKTIEELSDYKDVNGLMLPYTQKITVGQQIITISSTDVKLNEGVIKEDFK